MAGDPAAAARAAGIAGAGHDAIDLPREPRCVIITSCV